MKACNQMPKRAYTYVSVTKTTTEMELCVNRPGTERVGSYRHTELTPYAENVPLLRINFSAVYTFRDESMLSDTGYKRRKECGGHKIPGLGLLVVKKGYTQAKNKGSVRFFTSRCSSFRDGYDEESS